MAHLIQGWFIQERQWMGLGLDPVEGMVATINSGLCKCMYAGVIGQGPDGDFRLTGKMTDCCGEASLSHVHLTDNELSFIKTYDNPNRSDRIQYVFRPAEDGVWIGQYQGVGAGFGETWCVLTPIHDRWLDVESVIRKLKSQTS